MHTDKTVDLRGMCCAQPIIYLAKQLRQMQVGEVLLAEADKDSMRKDIPSFCKQTGHQLISHDEQNGLLRFWIRKE